jgi:hypothetical protein
MRRWFKLAPLRSRQIQTCSTPLVEVLEDRRLLSASPIKAPHAVKGSHTYTDGTFAPNNWKTLYTFTGVGGSATVTQAKKGGSPGAFQVITDTVDNSSVFFVFNRSAKANFNPVKQGAITSISYSESNKLISGFGQGQAAGPALEQNGKIYIDIDSGLVIPQTSWKKASISNLTAADFVTLDTGEHPDFSQTAAPISFGYARGNSAGSSYTISAAIDNWSLKVNTLKSKT